MITQQTASMVDIAKYETAEMKSVWRKSSPKQRINKTASTDPKLLYCSRRKLIRSLSGEFIAIKDVPLRFQTIQNCQIRQSLPNILDKIKQIRACYILDREIELIIQETISNLMQESLATGLSKICIPPFESPSPLVKRKPKYPAGLSNLVIGAADFTARFQKEFPKLDPVGVSLCKQVLHETENFEEDEIIYENKNQQYPAFNIPNVEEKSCDEWCESRRLSKSASNVKQVANLSEITTRSRPNTPGNNRRRNRGRKVDLELFR